MDDSSKKRSSGLIGWIPTLLVGVGAIIAVIYVISLIGSLMTCLTFLGIGLGLAVITPRKWKTPVRKLFSPSMMNGKWAWTATFILVGVGIFFGGKLAMIPVSYLFFMRVLCSPLLRFRVPSDDQNGG